MAMEIGCSSSRHGLTQAQKVAARRLLIDILREDNVVNFHHGDCVNGDAFLHDVATELGCRTISHPPENGALRAFKKATVVLPPKPYLVRNREIVDACKVMLICPDAPVYRVKSGTWYTWKYAKGIGKRVILIAPDGQLTYS